MAASLLSARQHNAGPVAAVQSLRASSSFSRSSFEADDRSHQDDTEAESGHFGIAVMMEEEEHIV